MARFPALRPRIALPLAASALTLSLAACTAAPPILAGAAARAPESVVVLVPGITGSELRDPATGRIAWGTAARLFSPKDGGRELALPIRPGEAPASSFEAFDVIHDIPFLEGVWKKEVYGPIERLFEANGFPKGNLLAPAKGQRFFVLPYDWRQDNVTSAALLVDKLEALRSLRAEARLAVTLICQSNGAHICRYAAKYGGRPLAEAEAGSARPPAGIHFAKLILVGTSNGGSLRILREMTRGRSYAPLVGRRWEPETLFTMPALYQDLPTEEPGPFLDHRGNALDLDLYDAANWERYGWGIFSRATRRRLAKEPAAFLGTEADQRAFLARTLADARRFHHLLAADPAGWAPPAIHLIQSLSTPTPIRAVLEQRQGTWRTSFTGDGRVDHQPRLNGRATAKGDGHATAASQLALSPQERAAIAGEPFFVDGPHFEMILKRETLVQLIALAAGDDPVTPP